MSRQPFAHAASAVAIRCEVAGTTALQRPQPFTRLWSTPATATLHAGAFSFMTRALTALPLGIVSALRSGVGIVLTAIVGAVAVKPPLDVAAVAGIVMIVGGVLAMQAFSTATGH